MKDYLPRIEEALDRYSAAYDLPDLFRESMRYSLLSGGKRIRACLCLSCWPSVMMRCAIFSRILALRRSSMPCGEGVRQVAVITTRNANC